MQEKSNGSFWVTGQAGFIFPGMLLMGLVIGMGRLLPMCFKTYTENSAMHGAVSVILVILFTLGLVMVFTRNRWKIDEENRVITEFNLGLFPGKTYTGDMISYFELEASIDNPNSAWLSFVTRDGKKIDLACGKDISELDNTASRISMAFDLPLKKAVDDTPFYEKVDLPQRVNQVEYSEIKDLEQTPDGFKFSAGTISPAKRRGKSIFSSAGRKRDHVDFHITGNQLTITGEDGKQNSIEIDDINNIKEVFKSKNESAVEILVNGKPFPVEGLKGTQAREIVTLLICALRELRMGEKS